MLGVAVAGSFKLADETRLSSATSRFRSIALGGDGCPAFAFVGCCRRYGRAIDTVASWEHRDACSILLWRRAVAFGVTRRGTNPQKASSLYLAGYGIKPKHCNRSIKKLISPVNPSKYQNAKSVHSDFAGPVDWISKGEGEEANQSNTNSNISTRGNAERQRGGWQI